MELPYEKYWAYVLRSDVIQMLTAAGSGHPAGALGMADIFTVLYFEVLNQKPSEPDWEFRDRLILSAGHICPILYAALAEKGYFPRKELLKLRQFGSPLQGHPHLGELAGIENSSGPLGQGLSQALGMAWVALRDHLKPHFYVVLSDGEHQEGQTWEAVLWAADHHLHNLTAIVDRNRIQISGNTEVIAPLDSLKQKYLAFGWLVIEIDGHNFSQIKEALLRRDHHQPICIIANTIPGKGVSFMENNFHWHGKAPSLEESEEALKSLTQSYATN